MQRKHISLSGTFQGQSIFLLHIPMKYAIIEHYSQNICVFILKTVIDQDYSYELQAEFPGRSIVQDIQLSN
jgi:hypothetical protein